MCVPLLAAIRVREKKQEKRIIHPASIKKVTFTKEMRKDYTILCPQMSPVHFELLEPAFRAAGYNIDVLPNDNKQAVDMGLKYVNNDACYRFSDRCRSDHGCTVIRKI